MNIKISHLAIDSTESVKHDQNYKQQVKDTLFWNRLQMSYIPCQYSWDYTATGMNMSIENNMLHLLCQKNKKEANLCFSENKYFFCAFFLFHGATNFHSISNT